MATLDQAVDQMQRSGMPPFPDGGPRLNTPGVVRYGPKKKAWYRLFEFVGRTGRRYIAGAYGLWGRIESAKIETDWEGMDPAELERVKRSQAELEEREKKKREDRAVYAANRARQQYMAAPFEGESPYLQRKQVAPEKGLRFTADGTLLVPMLRYDELQGSRHRPKLVGLQKIAADGTKRFNKGMAKQGAAFRLGVVRSLDPVMIAEGIATALSLRMALEALERKYPVFVAFDCGNLKPVAGILRKLYPKNAIVICADDDHATESNPGKTFAEAAAQAAGNAQVILPQFADRKDSTWTDFNDLHCAEGIDAVKGQIDAALTLVGAAREKKPRGKPPSTRTVDWSEFFGRYTLIYPTDTLWDAKIGCIVKVSNVKLAQGKDVVDFWLASPDRRMVNSDQVVFDPTESCGHECVNLFRGMPAKPKTDASCDKLIQLLHYLCGEDDAVHHWVLKWAAYPLQNPGAKMQTAIVMHGKEGAGKNLWWNTLRDIYGRYGSLITQSELESDYNAWMSQRLFLIANEVVSRHELRHYIGRLKNLITESPLPISEKYLPLRYEDNHMNMVFLTNELQALQIAPDDRRYMVIRTPEKREEAYYAEIVAELNAGGREALHRYLLEYECLEFDAHTKPLRTAAKDDLIELGLSSTQYFQQELHAGQLPMPYAPCLANDLYRAYAIFSPRVGERNPAKQNRFSHEFMAMNGVTRRVMRVEDPDDPLAEIKQRTVFLMGDRPEGEDEGAWVKKNVAAFRAALRQYARNDPLRGGQRDQDDSKNLGGPGGDPAY